jgi:hypothetical protein
VGVSSGRLRALAASKRALSAGAARRIPDLSSRSRAAAELSKQVPSVLAQRVDVRVGGGHVARAVTSAGVADPAIASAVVAIVEAELRDLADLAGETIFVAGLEWDVERGRCDGVKTAAAATADELEDLALELLAGDDGSDQNAPTDPTGAGHEAREGRLVAPERVVPIAPPSFVGDDEDGEPG